MLRRSLITLVGCGLILACVSCGAKKEAPATEQGAGVTADTAKAAATAAPETTAAPAAQPAGK